MKSPVRFDIPDWQMPAIGRVAAFSRKIHTSN
jgi:hypothetical protein